MLVLYTWAGDFPIIKSKKPIIGYTTSVLMGYSGSQIKVLSRDQSVVREKILNLRLGYEAKTVWLFNVIFFIINPFFCVFEEKKIIRSPDAISKVKMLSGTSWDVRWKLLVYKCYTEKPQKIFSKNMLTDAYQKNLQ